MSSKRNRFFVLVAIILSLSLLPACGTTVAPAPSTGPIFTDPAEKLSELSQSSFTTQLYNEAATLNPMLAQRNVQVHMGYWSFYANRGYLATLLDAINSQMSGMFPTDIAIWDEGVTTSLAMQYPSYITMNKEYWYERSGAAGGIVTIEGVAYTDPHPVTFHQADEIWGNYSRRYAEMANLIKETTGKKVKVWCFVQGAKKNRIFFTYEFPELAIMEANDAVQVFFARTSTSDWKNPGDWTEGTANAPAPVPALIQKLSLDAGPVEVADAYREGKFGAGPAAREAALNALSNICPGLSENEYEAAFARGLRLTAF